MFIGAVSNVGPLCNAAYEVVRGAVRLTAGSCISFGAGGLASTSGVAPAALTSPGWITGVLNWIRNFSFTGNNALRASGVIPEFWRCIGNLNFRGSTLLTSLRGLSGPGMGVLAITGLIGVIGLGLSVRNAISDFGTLNEISHDRSMENVRSPIYHMGKVASDVTMATGFGMLLFGGASAAFPVIIAGVAGLGICKIIEWFSSSRNPANNEGANLWFPLNHILALFKSNNLNVS